MSTPFHFHPSDARDCTPLVRGALARPDGQRLVFAPGRYDFHPEHATERFLFISNNDEGLKRIAFPLFEREDLEIDGGGALFVFHGGMVPFALTGSQNIRLSNFRIDWQVPFHCEATVLASNANGVDLEVSSPFSYRVCGGRLEFGHGSLHNILEFDPTRRETAFQVRDNYGIGARATATELAPGRIRLTAKFSEPRPQPGNILALMNENRDFPAIVVIGSEQVQVEDVTIHHAGGMGLIAQRSADITLQRVEVTPPPDAGRLISTTADATHFVNCRGQIRLLDCLFENQMDDATNIHGIYTQIVEDPAPDTLVVRIRHHQQFGVEIAAVGDRVEFVDGHSLATWHEAVVTSVTPLNKEYVRLVIDQPPPRPPLSTDAIGNLTWSADAEIRRCRCRGNRARGLLLSTAGKIVVEENEFHVPGAAILIAGDALDWFESGAVHDVLIRRNHFLNCNYGVWGRAAIQIAPEATEPAPGQPHYHRNIRVIENEFLVFDPRLVFARNVDGLEISDNRVRSSDDYQPQNPEASAFTTDTCLAVRLEQNSAAPFEPESLLSPA